MDIMRCLQYININKYQRAMLLWGMVILDLCVGTWDQESWNLELESGMDTSLM